MNKSSHPVMSLPTPIGSEIPNLKCSKSMEIMFHVVRKIRDDDEEAIPLEKVFDAKEWRDIIPSSKYVLVRVSMHDFLKNRKNLVLSYRWKNKIKVTCGGIAPGKIRLPVQKRELAIDFVRGLPYINEGGSLWVDFLCHLDVDVNRTLILNTMGTTFQSSKLIFFNE